MASDTNFIFIALGLIAAAFVLSQSDLSFLGLNSVFPDFEGHRGIKSQYATYIVGEQLQLKREDDAFFSAPTWHCGLNGEAMWINKQKTGCSGTVKLSCNQAFNRDINFCQTTTFCQEFREETRVPPWQFDYEGIEITRTFREAGNDIVVEGWQSLFCLRDGTGEKAIQLPYFKFKIDVLDIEFCEGTTLFERQRQLDNIVGIKIEENSAKCGYAAPTPGYNLVNNACVSVDKNAQYKTPSECESNIVIVNETDGINETDGSGLTCQLIGYKIEDNKCVYKTSGCDLFSSLQECEFNLPKDETQPLT